MSFSQWSGAEERGRQMAAAKLASDPKKREEMEKVYGVRYCQNRYPEAYTRRIQ